MELPTGTVTFLFTDVEGSTELVQRLGDIPYAEVLETHHALLRSVFASHHGREIDTQGDAFFVVFEDASDAVRAALVIQDAVATQRWPQQADIRLRIGIHTGAPQLVAGAYVGVDVHRAARICAAGHGGQILLSETTQALVEKILPAGVQLEDLGEHRLRDLRRPERIFHLLHPHTPPAAAPLRSLGILPHNLPVQLTSFVGRDREMREVRHLLGTTRLLTLTGPGGSGKTRLALQVAADLLDDYPDGIWLVELATLSDPGLILSAVGSVLDVREETGRAPDVTLLDALRGRHLLLILDNCEHLVEACAHAAASLLQAAPRLKIVATSRERLGVIGETSYLVPPLALPEVRREEAVAHLIRTESVRLFLERASSVQPGFTLTASDAGHIARIVQTLDGIPLAIELAAARVNVLSVPQIAERLYDRFRLLSNGGRTAAPRQQTLRATMDWSYDLLTEAERALLRRLSVFAGGWTLEAAEAVCTGGDVDRRDAVDLLARLVNKSIVMVDDWNGSRRFRLLDTVREYAREKREAAGEISAVRGRHCDWYRRLVEEAESHLEALDRHWMDRLVVEHDNLRVALDASSGADALRFAVALQPFWHIRGYWTEGRRWLEVLLAAAPDAAVALRAKALGRTAILVQLQGDHDRARALADEALSLYNQLGDTRGIAIAFNILGNIAYHQGDYRGAKELHEASLARGRAAGDKHSIASSLVNLAVVADHLEQYDQAVTWCRDSLTIFREIDEPRGIAFALSLLGTLAGDQGEYPAARPLLEESLALQRQFSDRQGVANTLVGLATVVREQGDVDAAHALLSESLAIRRELGNKHGMAASLYALAHLAARKGNSQEAAARFAESLSLRKVLSDKLGIAECLEGLARGATPERAARLLAAADAIRKAQASSRRPADQRDYEQLIARLRSAMGEATFRAAWDAGEALTPERAADEALSANPT